jgi:hypothetical protein
MEKDDNDFIFVRYDPVMNVNHKVHFMDILALSTEGVDIKFINLDKLTTTKQFSKYKFLLKCLEERQKHFENLKTYNEEIISLIDPEEMDIFPIDIDLSEIEEFANSTPFLS